MVNVSLQIYSLTLEESGRIQDPKCLQIEIKISKQLTALESNTQKYVL